MYLKGQEVSLGCDLETVNNNGKQNGSAAFVYALTIIWNGQGLGDADEKKELSLMATAAATTRWQILEKNV